MQFQPRYAKNSPTIPRLIALGDTSSVQIREVRLVGEEGELVRTAELNRVIDRAHPVFAYAFSARGKCGKDRLNCCLHLFMHNLSKSI